MAAKTINVATAAQLTAALKTVKGGETILLAAGDYGALSIKSLAMTSTVTIKSADAAHPAVFSGMGINGGSGFRFENIDLHRPLAAGEADFTQAAVVMNSSNLQFVGMHFTGSMDGNAANDGVGLRIITSKDISVTGSSFEQWKNAVILADDTNVTVSGNTLTGVVNAFNLQRHDGATFSGNNFIGVKEGWSTPTAAGKNVAFVDNHTTLSTPVIQTGAGTVIKVATAAQLNAAIAAVKGGETILLAPGDYGAIGISHRNLTGGTVTIKSADSNHDAVFSNIRIADATGFTFQDVDVHRPLATGEIDSTSAAYVSGSNKINFIGVDFTGSLDNNAWNDGVGLRVSYSNNVGVIDSTFTQWTNSATFDQDSGLVVTGNSVSGVREGFGFAAVHDVTIAQNLFTAFQPKPGDHSDAIQFWNAYVNEGSTHVVIRDNVILQGANQGSQGIFIRAENQAFRHSDFVVENNLYNGDARHGITVTGVNNAVIQGNTVTSAPGGLLESGINIGNDSNILIANNLAPLLLDNGNTTGVVWRDNIDLWDSKQNKGASLASVFQGSATGTDIASYAVKAGSAAAALHAGFAYTDGIGAASFDLSHTASYTHVAAALAAQVMA